jgi:hypothetical protein
VGRAKVGEWVEVRSRKDILATLDSQGRLGGMPFMPEMLAFCGKRFPIYKRAHKTCDTVFPIRGRRVDDAVHLNTRCDGKAHGNCQARCLIFWKEAWLKPVTSEAPDQAALFLDTHSENTGSEPASGCTESELWSSTQVADSRGELSYVCQATQLPYATMPLAWWEIGQYFEDYFSGNVSLVRICQGAVYSLYYNLSNAGIGVGPAMRWLYEKLSWLRHGSLWPRRTGTISKGSPTPAAALNIQPGEYVRVKSHLEILQTLDIDSKNRGMYWDAELLPYCGGIYKVLDRINRIIDEKTGKIQEMKTPCIILDSVICQARYSDCRMFCPRSIYSYWREIWLERVEPSVAESESKAMRHLD